MKDIARLEVQPDFSLVKIVELAGTTPDNAQYINGVLWVKGVTQDALNAAALAYDDQAEKLQILEKTRQKHVDEIVADPFRDFLLEIMHGIVVQVSNIQKLPPPSLEEYKAALLLQYKGKFKI